MKSSIEIKELLIQELKQKIDYKISGKTNNNLNDLLGKTSIYLAKILELNLKEKKSWNKNNWIDDAILTELNVIETEIVIKGIMIYGKQNTTQEWVDPFMVSIKIKEPNEQYFFFFKFKNIESLDYNIFSKNRNYYQNKIEDWDYIFQG